MKKDELKIVSGVQKRTRLFLAEVLQGMIQEDAGK